MSRKMRGILLRKLNIAVSNPRDRGVRWRNGDGIEVSLCVGADAVVVARHPSFLRHEKVLEIN